jgi:hypothetical protein
MGLYVAYFKFRPGTNALQGLEAFERRKTFQHPPQANVIGTAMLVLALLVVLVGQLYGAGRRRATR